MYQTDYFCIFNADGSFNPNELKCMYDKLENSYIDIIFASRYEKDCSSEDDTIITYVSVILFSQL